jgi:hypothetical protein
MAEEDRELSRGPPRIMASEPEMFTFVGQFIFDLEGLMTFRDKKYFHISAGKEIIGGFKNGLPDGLVVVMRDLEV